MNKTNQCVANCPKGNGTATDNKNYSDCVQVCISSYYLGGTTTAACSSPTGGSGSGSGSGNGNGNGATTTGAAGSGAGGSSPSGTATGKAGSETSKAAAADVLRVGGSAVGMLGFLAAFLAL